MLIAIEAALSLHAAKHHLSYTGEGQNNGNLKKLRNRIRVGYIERT
jgi:hypothetical protein